MTTTTTEQFSLRWNNFHSNLTSGVHELLQAHEMVDVTLAVEGHLMKAHKLVLSICSPYFKEMFRLNPCKHPIVILKDIGHSHMKDILEFMYMGEVNVLRENLSAFLRTAELLQVKGLTGDDSSDTASKKDDDKSDSIIDHQEQEEEEEEGEEEEDEDEEDDDEDHRTVENLMRLTTSTAAASAAVNDQPMDSSSDDVELPNSPLPLPLQHQQQQRSLLYSHMITVPSVGGLTTNQSLKRTLKSSLATHHQNQSQSAATASSFSYQQNNYCKRPKDEQQQIQQQQQQQQQHSGSNNNTVCYLPSGYGKKGVKLEQQPETDSNNVNKQEMVDEYEYYEDPPLIRPSRPSTAAGSEENRINLENEEGKNALKQLIENSLNATTPTATAGGAAAGDVIMNSSDQDVLLFNVDDKGHVYCPYCFRKFVNRYNLKVHIRDKHDDSPTDLQCRMCGKVMRNRSCLRVHMYHHRKQQLDNAAIVAAATAHHHEQEEHQRQQQQQTAIDLAQQIDMI